jgi:uncharacterized membrane protein
MSTKQDRMRVFYELAHKNSEQREADIRKLEDLIASAVSRLKYLHVGHEDRRKLLDEIHDNTQSLMEKQAIIDFVRKC